MVTRNKGPRKEAEISRLKSWQLSIRQKIAEIESIEAEVERGKLWPYLQKKYKPQLDRVEDELYNYESLTEEQRTTRLERKKIYLNFLALEDFVKSKEKLSQQLLEIGNQLKELEGKEGKDGAV